MQLLAEVWISTLEIPGDGAGAGTGEHFNSSEHWKYMGKNCVGHGLKKMENYRGQLYIKMWIQYFSNNPNIHGYVGKLLEQLLKVQMFSNPEDKTIFFVKFNEVRISE